MEEDQKEKCYICKFCKQSFSNGKKLGGHMRGHLALISASKNQVIKENFEESINGEKVLELEDAEIKKSQEKLGFDDIANGYGLRENPKKSWRVSDTKRIANSGKHHHHLCETCGKGFHSMRALAGHMRSHSPKTKESSKKNLCRKCGKGFDSVKALYGHMRCHSSKRSRPSVESTSSSSSSSLSSEEEDGKIDGGGATCSKEMANPIRKKRSCTRYKSTNPDNPSACSSLSSFVPIAEHYDDEVEEGAICLMMLKKGVRNLDRVQLVISSLPEFAVSDSFYSRTIGENIENEVTFDGSMEVCKFKNQPELDLKKDLMAEIQSSQIDMGLVKYNLTNGKAYDDQSATGSDTSKDFLPIEQEMELERRSKHHKCPICSKEFGSGQALGGHKRAHYNAVATAATRVKEETDNFPESHTLFDLNHFPVKLEQGVNNGGGIELKSTWIRSDVEWDPLLMVN